MGSKILVEAIKQAWDDKTCYPVVRAFWTPDKPELGQCAVTALVVQDKLGGEILYNSKFDHYWNVLPNGSKLDLTRKQFDTKVAGPAIPVKREEILETEGAKKFKTGHRYKLLKKRVELSLVH